MITTSQGNKPIEQMQVGDYALTRDGYKPVRIVGLTIEQAEVYTVTFSDGRTLTGTGNHPVYLKGKGYTPLRAMRYGDIIMDINPYKERYPSLCQNEQPTEWKQSSTRVSPSGATQIHPIGQTRVTTDPDRRMLPQALKLSILRYGKMLTDLYQMDVRSTTRTVTLPTMLSKIWNVSHQRSMQSTMLRTSVKSVWKSCVNELTMPGLPLVRGTSQKLVGNGTRNWARWLGRTPSISQGSVTIARKNFKQLLLAMKSSTALTTANQQHAVSQALTMRRVPVGNAEKNLSATSMQESSTATPYVLSVIEEEIKQPVYNLTVENPVGEGEYFANGVLVHNCDRYLCKYFSSPRTVSYFKAPRGSSWGV